MKIVNTETQRIKLFFNILVLAISFYSVSQQDVAYKQSSAFENLMIEAFAPLQSGVSIVKERVSNLFSDYVANVRASKMNRKLWKEVQGLNQQLFQYEELEKENNRLKKLLEFGQEIPRKRVLAQIVAWDASSDLKVLRVNKGIKDGITLQSTVVTSKGLVGYVYRLTNSFADILTILDPKNRVDGIVQRTRSHGIIEGQSGSTLSMKYVGRTEPVIINDIIITSGLGNVYPKGLKIGRISLIERASHGITQKIEVTPSVDFSKLEEVVILVTEGDEIKRQEWKILDDEKRGDE